MVALVVVLAVGWLAFRGYQAVRALEDARTAARALESALLGADSGGADLVAAQRAAARAVSATSDPIWRAAEVLPWAGDQLRAVRAVAESLHRVTRDVLPPVVDLVGQVRDGRIRTADGSFDVAAIASAGSALDTADESAGRASAQIAAVDQTRLVGVLAGEVASAQRQLATVATTVHSARQLADLAPGMLGASGSRTYLVIALNGAELRSAGGIVGAVTALHLDRGKLSLGTQLSTSDLTSLPQPVLSLTADELALEGDRLGRWVQDASMTPDFPRTGQLVAARWVKAVGGTVDGVVGLDVPAVAELLSFTGPVTTSDGQTLTSKTFASAVLRDSYLSGADSAQIDGRFADVASAVFTKLSSSSASGTSLLHALRSVVEQRRLHLWSAHPEEQTLIGPSAIGGAFLTGPSESSSGIFLNDATAGKLDYYLTTDLTVRNLSCRSGTGTATARLVLTYRPPAGIATAPLVLRGPTRPGRVAGHAVTTVSVYAAAGAPVGPITVDGVGEGGMAVTRGGRASVTMTIDLAPGASTTIDVSVPVTGGVATVWSTPTLSQGGLSTGACPALAPTATPSR